MLIGLGLGLTVARRAAAAGGGGGGGFTDTWTGTDGTLVAGRTTTTGAKTWADALGPLKIVSNQITPAVNADAGAVADAGATDATVTAKVTSLTGTQGVFARYVDASNFIILFISGGGGTVTAYSMVANAQSNYTVTGLLPVVVSDVIGLRLSGTTLSVLKNGSVVYSTTLASNPGGTKFGPYLGSTGAASDDCTVTVP